MYVIYRIARGVFCGHLFSRIVQYPHCPQNIFHEICIHVWAWSVEIYNRKFFPTKLAYVTICKNMFRKKDPGFVEF